MTRIGIRGKEQGLKPAQYRAVAALVATGDVRAVAKAVGASERTVRRWMAMPAFKAELRDAETELVQTAARRLGRLADKALGVLEGVMDDPEAADNPRIRAAATVLDTCLRWREQVDLEQRLRTLEEGMEKKH